MSVGDVTVDTVEEKAGRVMVAGSVQWSRRHRGEESEVEERFRVDCPVPSLLKTPKSVRPTIIVQVMAGSAA